MTDLGSIRLDKSSIFFEHPLPYASGLGSLVFCEVSYLTGTMLMHRRCFYHDRKWRDFAAFCIVISKKVRYIGKNRTPFYGVSLFDF